MFNELSVLLTLRFGDYPFDTLYIWTTHQALPILRQRIEQRWQASKIAVMRFKGSCELFSKSLVDRSAVYSLKSQ